MSTKWIVAPRDIFAGGEIVKAGVPTEVPELVADDLIAQALAEPAEQAGATKKRAKADGDV